MSAENTNLESIENELRKFRSSIATKENMRPTQVFTEAEIQLLLRELPTNLVELGKLKGFPAGKARWIKYGKAIVDIINGRKAPSNLNAF